MTPYVEQMSDEEFYKGMAYRAVRALELIADVLSIYKNVLSTQEERDRFRSYDYYDWHMNLTKDKLEERAVAEFRKANEDFLMFLDSLVALPDTPEEQLLENGSGRRAWILKSEWEAYVSEHKKSIPSETFGHSEFLEYILAKLVGYGDVEIKGDRLFLSSSGIKHLHRLEKDCLDSLYD